MARTLNKLALLTAVAVTAVSCQKSAEDAPSVAVPKTLYVTAGICNSGPGTVSYNATAATLASKSVTSWDASSGQYKAKIIDWNVASGFANSFPQQVFVSGDELFILAENATTMSERKIFRVNKNDVGNYSTVVPTTASAAPAAAATHLIRSMRIDNSGMITMNRTVSIEKFNPLGAIIPAPTAATSYINPAAATAPCITAAILPTGTVTAGGTYIGISDIELLDPGYGKASGKTIFSIMGAAAANNRLAVANADGMTSTTVAHCAAGVQISTTTHTLAANLCPQGSCANPTFDASGVSPTAILLVRKPTDTVVGKLIVAYGPSNTGATSQNNSTNLNHGIVMWDVTETSVAAVTLNNPVVLFNNDQILIGPSALAYDESTSSLYVGVGPNARASNQTTGLQGYNIEKFTLDIDTPQLTRVVDSTLRPFIVGNSDTKCISGLTIGD